jgi:membrane protein DedA with SNARE-associated domain
MLESLIDTYGYPAVLVGTFFEGETVLVLGGFASHRGYLACPGGLSLPFIFTNLASLISGGLIGAISK